jgi:hypothetical protein
MFVVLGSVDVQVFLFSGPNNTNWFDTAQIPLSLREILNSVPREWGVGNTVRIEGTIPQTRPLNPIVLSRITTGSAGVWAPLNIHPMHMDGATRYRF